MRIQNKEIFTNKKKITKFIDFIMVKINCVHFCIDNIDKLNTNIGQLFHQSLDSLVDDAIVMLTATMVPIQMILMNSFFFYSTKPKLIFQFKFEL